MDEPEPSEEQSDVIAQLINMMQETIDSSNEALNTAQQIISGVLPEPVPDVDEHVIVFTYTQ